MILFKTTLKKKDYAEKFSETTGIEIQSQHWGGNRKLSMEVIYVGYYPNTESLGNKEKNLNSNHV